MKKVFLILVLILSLSSCNISFYDKDGFTIFGYGAVVEENQVLIQSRESFIINDRIYREVIINDKAIVENKLNHDINIKITKSRGKTEWIILTAKTNIEILAKE